MKLKKIFTSILLLVFSLTSCTNALVTEECSCIKETDFIIKSGTSYGFCIGYCKSELSINSDLQTYYEKKSHVPNTDYPDFTNEKNISQVTFDSIYNSLNLSVFNSLPDTLSDCLDCTDQGAEWIEVLQNGESKIVVFDAGNDVEGLEDLIAILRRLREEHN